VPQGYITQRTQLLNWLIAFTSASSIPPRITHGTRSHSHDDDLKQQQIQMTAVFIVAEAAIVEYLRNGEEKKALK
jgi:hypothetical protein